MRAVVAARVDDAAARLVLVPRLPRAVVEGLAVDRDHRQDAQAVLEREREIALVVARHAHHRAVAVAHQHVVADPHLDLRAGQRVRDVQPGRHAFLLHRREVRLDDRPLPRLVDERAHVRRASGGDRRERMLGRDGDERDAHDRVGARREHVEPAVADRVPALVADLVREREAHALAAADPVRLHRAHALGPAVHAVERASSSSA
jgi:hypothetical protein